MADRTFTLTETEIVVFLRLLDDYRDKLSVAGCNDFELPNTPDNYAMMQEVIASGDYPEDKPSVFGKNICCLDWVLLEYFENKLEGGDK